MGIGRKFQRPTVFQGHTVFENCELALRARRASFTDLFARLSPAQRARIDEVLETGRARRATRHRPAGLLAHGQKQWLEIGMLLAQEPKVLLIDEPVAGMTQPEMERTAELLARARRQAHGRRRRARHGVRAQHRAEGDRAARGAVLAEGPMDEIQTNPRVIEVYLGDMTCSTAAKVNQFYGGSHTLWDVELEVPAGGCVCLMGRNGVGKTTLLKVIMGLLPARRAA